MDFKKIFEQDCDRLCVLHDFQWAVAFDFEWKIQPWIQEMQKDDLKEMKNMLIDRIIKIKEMNMTKVLLLIRYIDKLKFDRKEFPVADFCCALLSDMDDYHIRLIDSYLKKFTYSQICSILNDDLDLWGHSFPRAKKCLDQKTLCTKFQIFFYSFLNKQSASLIHDLR
jgi:hypothetical protein